MAPHQPVLQHESWAPLWHTFTEVLEKGHESAASFMSPGGEVSLVPPSELAAVQRAIGDAQPLFGFPDTSRFFLWCGIEGTHRHPTSCTAPSSRAIDAESVSPGSVISQAPCCSPLQQAESLAAAAAASASLHGRQLFLECFRVDSYMPLSIQMQAAVQHLLQTRCRSSASASSAVFPSRRIVTDIAMVTADHLIGAQKSFMDALERERQLRETVTAGNDETPVVRLMLFNSTKLVRYGAV